jgi:hypothetical protein
VTCTPNHVHVYQSMMVFESLEDDVPTWITFIDKWTTAANARHAEQQAARGRPPTPAPRRPRPQARRTQREVQESNEKFKNL